MTRVVRHLLVVGVLLGLPAASLTEAAGPAPSSAPETRSALLEVPYLAQKDALCGGAAMAMVMRFWGDRTAAARDYQSLVPRGEHGIPAGDLAAAVTERGWTVVAVRGAAGNGTSTPLAAIDRHIANGEPIVALIEERPRVNHYVVVVGVTPDAVVVHDPARGPYQVVARDVFVRQSAAAGGFVAAVLPQSRPARGLNGTGNGTATHDAAATGTVANGAKDGPLACTAIVERHLILARDGDHDGAKAGLEAATQLCPDDAAAWRGLANVQFLKSEWPTAELSAARAVALAPGDASMWRLLATSRFLQDDFTGALEAWNHVGEPLADVVTVHGISRIDESTVLDLANISADTMLTRGRLHRATRRLELLPGVSQARVTLAPGRTGAASVDVFVKEQKRYPTSLTNVATIGGKAVLTDEIRLDIANLTGQGDVWTGAYRWSGPRRRVIGRLESAVPHLPGVVSLEGLFERQTYLVPALGTVVEGRRRVSATVTDWRTSWWRWSGGAAFDRIAERNHLGFDGGIDLRALRDHLSFIGTGSVWTPLQTGEAFASGQTRDWFASGLTAVAWRTATEPVPLLFHGDVGFAAATAASPLAVWPGSHTNPDRGGSMRAHPMREDDIISGEVFGRRIAFATVTSEQLVMERKFGRVSIAEFVDMGRAWDRLAGLDTSLLHVDIGVGLRFASAKAGGIIRLDIARGVRDGRNHFSAGYMRAWPGR
jgi:hypothetical protein